MTNQSDLFTEKQTAGRFTLNADGGSRGNGSKHAVGGWGAYIVNDDTGEELDLWEGKAGATNNQMELMAVIKGLQAIPPGAETLVITDSQYVQKGISEWVKGWKRKGWMKADGKPVLNVELWKELDALVSERKNVKFQWVRGHAGHPGNERADALTNRAMDAVSGKGN